MSRSAGDLHIRLEVLRVRGELLRAEAANARTDLGARAAPARQWLALAAQVRASRRGAAEGLLHAAMTGLRLRPWLIPVGLTALRLARRHPLAALAAAGGGLAAWLWWRSRGRQPPR